jgi:hypothetical protein
MAAAASSLALPYASVDDADVAAVAGSMNGLAWQGGIALSLPRHEQKHKRRPPTAV